LLDDVKTIRVRFVRLQSRGTALDRRDAAIVSPLASLRSRSLGAVRGSDDRRAPRAAVYF
jgi:hypothetical protein